jgi:hypothetical protein
MKVTVECYAGHRGEEEPRAFTLGETRFEVQAIEDRQRLGRMGTRRARLKRPKRAGMAVASLGACRWSGSG